MYYYKNGQEVYFQSIGKGPSLILLHGWGNDVSSFWPITEKLKDSFMLYLIDLPGFGRSSLPNKPWFVKDYANLIVSFIKDQRIKNPILLGHSIGGRIAIKIAANNPKTLSKLILEYSAEKKKKRTFLNLFVFAAAKFIKYLIPNIFNFKLKLRHKLYKTIESDYETAGNLRETFLNIIKEDLISDIKKIKIETLILWGEKDQNEASSLQHAKTMYQLIENSRLELIEDATHFPHLENPKKFIYFVKDFCSLL